MSAMADSGPSRSGAERHGRLEVEIVRHAGDWDRAMIAEAMLKRAAKAAFAAAPPPSATNFEVTIVLTDDLEMRALNRSWRGQDAPTNVLSFPAGEGVSEGLIGDVVLGHETVSREARELGIPLSDHVSHLVVHGVLHLLGFDHARDDAAAAMEKRESQALASLNIADPYAEGGEAEEVSP